MKTSFGLDLAGYSKCKSALARATISKDGPPTVAILTRSVFAQKVDGKNRLPGHVAGEIECLRTVLNEGSLFIDVPIDLRGLLSPRNPQFVWQLTKRPVDQAFGGLPPLADRLGACVARMQNLRKRLLTNGQGNLLEHGLFETYPAGSLKLAGKNHGGYKGGRARYSQEHRWQPSREGNDRDSALAALLNNLQWTADGEIDGFTDDEFDAALCALTGFDHRLCGEDLREEINRRLAESGYGNGYSAPRGYVLLKEIPPDVSLCRRRWAELE